MSSGSSKTRTRGLPEPGMELMWMRYLAPTSTDARVMARRMEADLAAAKIRSPRYPGWYVGWNVFHHQCTVMVVFHVEPEAELPQP